MVLHIPAKLCNDKGTTKELFAFTYCLNQTNCEVWIAYHVSFGYKLNSMWHFNASAGLDKTDNTIASFGYHRINTTSAIFMLSTYLFSTSDTLLVQNRYTYHQLCMYNIPHHQFGATRPHGLHHGVKDI